MKKIVALFSALIISFTSINVFGVTDEYILKDKPENTYIGRIEAQTLINNLQFTDIPEEHYAREAIVRDGALNLVKGYNDKYLPNENVTNAEAIAFVLRIIGRENEAITRGNQLKANGQANINLLGLWSIGYLDLARQLGLITPAEFAESIAEPTADIVFKRNSPVSRERLASWIDKALISIKADAFAKTDNATVQKLISLNDFDTVDSEYAASVEKIALNGIMTGDSKGNFNPKGRISRAEMAVVLKNMDSVYFQTMGYERKTGTVGAVRDIQNTTTGQASIDRNLYIRTLDGKLDLLNYRKETNNVLSKNTDAVVYKNKKIAGLASLNEGDEIEYIVKTESKEVVYVNVLNELVKTQLQAYLIKVDAENNSITLKDTAGKEFVFKLAIGMLGEEDKIKNIFVDDKRTDLSKLSYGSIYKLTLVNNIVTVMDFVGEPNVYNEIRGIVIENNQELGYLVIIDNSGKEVVKYFYEDDLKVEKQHLYDIEDEVGYIDEVFPNFKFDPRDGDMSSIEIGDIVFLKLSTTEPDHFVSISAATDYVMKYGKIKQIVDNVDYTTILIEFENKQTAYYDIVDSVFVSSDGKPIAVSDIKIGDWAKILVNQAIIAPGNVIESAKELIIEGNEHFISGIIKGNLSGIDAVQNKLVISDTYELIQTGWANHKNLSTYSIAGKDIEYYNNDKKISLDQAMKFFKRSESSVYIALDNHFSGTKVKKVTFRNGFDQPLDADIILTGDNVGTFTTLSHLDNLKADAGSIIRRNGRLVDQTDIFMSDYAHVVRNGETSAAVVDIYDIATTEKVTFSRARVLSVDQGKNFSVQSLSVLSGIDWNYTPVQRTFAIDHKTVFITSEGVTDFEDFLGYTDTSVLDKAYNIVIDGSRASYVVDSKYARIGVRGNIYKVDEETNSVSIKDATFYNEETKKWMPVSKTNSTLDILYENTTLTAKNNEIVQLNKLKIGDQLLVLTDKLPEKISSTTPISSIISVVEK